jgi:hypothetical protein
MRNKGSPSKGVKYRKIPIFGNRSRKKTLLDYWKVIFNLNNWIKEQEEVEKFAIRQVTGSGKNKDVKLIIFLWEDQNLRAASLL